MQRLCDSFHNVIASVAVSILVDVVYSEPSLHTDEALKDFCEMALEHDRFLYSNTDFEDPNVVFPFNLYD